jgi:hypothetical protein
LALFLFAVFTVVGVTAYARITYRDQHKSRLLDSLEIGTKRYYVTQQKRCSGILTRTISEQDKEITVNIDYALDVRLKDQLWPTTLEFRAEFNALGQLAASILKLSTPHGLLKVGTLEINPIRASVSFETEKHTAQRNLDVPGPIELWQNPSGGFDLRYRYLEKLNAGHSNKLLTNFIKRLDLEITSDPPPQCQNKQYSPLDLRLPESIFEFTSKNNPLSVLAEFSRRGAL